MKKLIVIFLSAALGLGFSVTAFAADIELGGDARVRGVWASNYDFDSDLDADDRYYDQRVRLKVNAKAGDVELRTRMTVAEGVWGDPVASVTGVIIDADDYAYLHFPVGPVTIDAGRQLFNWGHKFLVWAEGVNRIKVTGKVEGYTVGGFVDKLFDTRAALTGDDNLVDANNYGLFAVGKVAGVNGGVVLMHTSFDLSVGGVTGQALDVFASGKVADISIAGELVYTMGDFYETPLENLPMGFFVSAAMPVDVLNVSAALAYTSNGFEAGRYFAPTVFLGTSQPTAIGDVGFLAGDDDSSYALVVAADYKATNEATVGAKLAYASLSDTNEATATEVDLTLKYRLASNLNFGVDFGYLMPDGLSAADDAAMALAAKVEMKF